MCCNGKLELTQKFLEKKKTIKVYKLVRKVRGTLDGLHPSKYILRGVYQYFEYKPGLIVSGSAASTIISDTNISIGIHCWLSKKSAEKHQNNPNVLAGRTGLKIVELTANIDDLIAVGRFDSGVETDNAVFRKVNLSQSEYDKALGKKAKVKK